MHTLSDSGAFKNPLVLELPDVGLEFLEAPLDVLEVDHLGAVHAIRDRVLKSEHPTRALGQPVVLLDVAEKQLDTLAPEGSPSLVLVPAAAGFLESRAHAGSDSSN